MPPDASILSASAALPLGHRILKTIQAILPSKKASHQMLGLAFLILGVS
jgi:hypothetical protein